MRFQFKYLFYIYFIFSPEDGLWSFFFIIFLWSLMVTCIWQIVTRHLAFFFYLFPIWWSGEDGLLISTFVSTSVLSFCFEQSMYLNSYILGNLNWWSFFFFFKSYLLYLLCCSMKFGARIRFLFVVTSISLCTSFFA